jgi:hypothetical protein
MNTKKCPMCGDKQFYFVCSDALPAITLGLFKQIPVGSAVCLGCGFVAPSVDAEGLARIREKAKSEGFASNEAATKHEVNEL